MIELNFTVFIGIYGKREFSDMFRAIRGSNQHHMQRIVKKKAPLASRY